jgi:hypothetical protein
MPRRIALKASSIREGGDVFRGSDLTTAIFGTERFVDALRGSGVGELITSEEVDIVSGP